MTVMPPAKDTDSSSGTQGQATSSAQTSCTAGSTHQVSTVNSSTVNWNQINRPWGDQHKSTGSDSETKIAHDMDSSKIIHLPLTISLFLKSLDIQAL